MTKSDKKATREGKQWAGAQHRDRASTASSAPRLRVNGLREKLSQGLFSSTLYPGTDLDSTERLEPSFLVVATLSFDFCLP